MLFKYASVILCFKWTRVHSGAQSLREREGIYQGSAILSCSLAVLRNAARGNGSALDGKRSAFGHREEQIRSAATPMKPFGHHSSAVNPFVFISQPLVSYHNRSSHMASLSPLCISASTLLLLNGCRPMLRQTTACTSACPPRPPPHALLPLSIWGKGWHLIAED